MRHAPIQLDLMEASSAASDYTTSLLRLTDCLLQLLAGRAFQSESIDTNGFRRTIERFRQALPGATESRALADLTFDCLETCEQFHQQTLAYLGGRETALLDMIELLRTTVATISRGSLGYEQQIDASTERLSHAARLDDLKELKGAIQADVESIRRTTNERGATGRPVPSSG